MNLYMQIEMAVEKKQTAFVDLRKNLESAYEVIYKYDAREMFEKMMEQLEVK